ncbi:glutamine synthetase family protein [Streptomyces sp. N2-109]|uniref:Glutamine synthetase family protein n=1 Tax=Streptomyces gossypii TaxID=2883101 RepID=A0ABT2JKP1_9ACTN|nr:glutamine synthetase family protein [Streptomyces gossypii]MCT2588448.1 glutamine synthetase family protein [Streptomyces gossypii]
MYSRSWSPVHTEGGAGRPAFAVELGLWSAEQAAAAEQIEAHLEEVDLVRLVFCDPHGLARSKTLTAQTFRTVLRGGMDFSPGPFLFDTGHAVAVDFLGDPGVGVPEIAGAGNFVLVPDPLTFQMLPGREPRTAWVLGDEFLRDGTPHPLSARNVLRQVCAQYAARRWSAVVGLEVEWYLTRRLPGEAGNAGNGFGLQGAAPVVEALNAGYQFNSDSAYDSVSPVTDPLAMLLLELGLPLRSMEHESGPGQIETTFNPMGALEAADAMLMFRTLTKQTCARSGHHASFMSLPGVEGFDPSGWHLHQSVREEQGGGSLFAAGGPGGGISAQGRAYVEGLLARARDFCLLSVPTVNGYRRLGSGFALSPTRVGWSFEDRSVMVRVVGGRGSTHIENRVGEPSANPYLAIAAQLFAGLEGLTASVGASAAPQTQTETQNAQDARGAEGGWGALPQSLGEALEAFRGGQGPQLLGKPLASCLTKLKESELARFQAWQEARRRAGHQEGGAVTDWEQREYFASY